MPNENIRQVQPTSKPQFRALLGYMGLFSGPIRKDTNSSSLYAHSENELPKSPKRPKPPKASQKPKHHEQNSHSRLLHTRHIHTHSENFHSIVLLTLNNKIEPFLFLGNIYSAFAFIQILVAEALSSLRYTCLFPKPLLHSFNFCIFVGQNPIFGATLFRDWWKLDDLQCIIFFSLF